MLTTCRLSARPLAGTTLMLASLPGPVPVTMTITHEQYVHAVRDIAAARIGDDAQRAEVLVAKLVYGVGDGHYRGACYHQAWTNGKPGRQAVVEIAATGEESPTQLAGTTIHELGHVLAGHSAGHGREWAGQCARLGLAHAAASGQGYTQADFVPEVWSRVNALPVPNDGLPAFRVAGGYLGLPGQNIRPCPLGIGTKGGKSRGKGSGSRMRLYHCQCDPPVKVRAATDTLDATCNVCGTTFALRERPVGRL